MASSSCAALVSPHRRSGAHGSRGSGGMRRLEVSARSAGGRGAGRGGGRGAPGGRAPQQQQQQRTDGQGASKPKPPKLPEYGYFSQADTKAPVYAPLAGRESGDFTKRGGRWNPEFIWNTNWVEQLDYQEKLKKDRAKEESKKQSTKGGLGLSRMADLNDMDIDFSDKLSKPKPTMQSPVNVPIRKSKTIVKEVYAPPSQGEARRWARSTRFSKKVVQVTTTEEDEALAEAARREENERFDALKKELQLLNAGLTAGLFAATYAFYPADTAYSFLFGALGGAQYLRMLNRSVEGYGTDSIGGVVGQQRILIPVILALGFNRFNELASEPTGVTLELLPILAGFFTYKVSVLSKSSLSLFRDLSTNYGKTELPSKGSEGGGKGAEDKYRDQILRG